MLCSLPLLPSLYFVIYYLGGRTDPKRKPEGEIIHTPLTWPGLAWEYFLNRLIYYKRGEPQPKKDPKRKP
jgi:hypothetical protein